MSPEEWKASQEQSTTSPLSPEEWKATLSPTEGKATLSPEEWKKQQELTKDKDLKFPTFEEAFAKEKPTESVDGFFGE